MTPQTRAEAEKLDASDPLRPAREAFRLPDGVIYLDGNSLGPPPMAALDRLEEAAREEWQTGLIRSWNDANWIDLPKSCGAKIASLIGAAPDDVIVADSVSINIFKLAGALWKQNRGALAVSAREFPTDGYIMQGLSALTDAPLIALTEDAAALPENVSVLVKSAADYRTAEIADIAAWEARAAASGAAIIWDLSHATGLLHLDLKRDGAKYAVGCGYKFLNGGPGAPAFLYVDGASAGELNQPLSGWMGHAEPFAFDGAYRPAARAQRFACGTPPILSLSALDAALDVYADISLQDVEDKARALGDLFLSRAQDVGLRSVSPPAGERRGGHVSLEFDHGFKVVQALIARGVIGDFRKPNLMRFGFSPLYLSFADIWDATDALQDILQTEEWRDEKYAVRHKVT